jgi:hypothetical protein
MVQTEPFMRLELKINKVEFLIVLLARLPRQMQRRCGVGGGRSLVAVEASHAGSTCGAFLFLVRLPASPRAIYVTPQYHP